MPIPVDSRTTAAWLEVLVLDGRRYPLARAKVSEVQEITALFTQAAALNPAVTPELLLRAIVHAGLREVKGHLAKRRLPPTINLLNVT